MSDDDRYTEDESELARVCSPIPRVEPLTVRGDKIARILAHAVVRHKWPRIEFRQLTITDSVFIEDLDLPADIVFAECMFQGSACLTNLSAIRSLTFLDCTIPKLFVHHCDMTRNLMVFLGDVQQIDIEGLHLTGSKEQSVKLESSGWLDLISLTADAPVRMDLRGERILLTQASLTSGGRVACEAEYVMADNASFGARTVIAGRTFHGKQLTHLYSLDGADCTNLELDNLDLSGVHFGKASGLGKLRIVDQPNFPLNPGRLSSRRQVIADELTHGGSAAQWRRVSEVYRQLRAGMDDARASDMYYGEMNCRRLGTPWSVDRFVLTLYWLTSGYGTRAWRALASWGVLLAGATGLFISRWPEAVKAPSFGKSLWRGFRHAFESSTALLRASEGAAQPDVAIAEWVLRLLTPALIGLAVLALRNRVKRGA
ncbi:hypothetical protein D5S17_25130 [Pseudonocardiaceae bacterium YIM PH 21723]|nr:hypothetical protein D5S17_25130 [Pseudonocardiaceae bacterium YIM PH 21723]